MLLWLDPDHFVSAPHEEGLNQKTFTGWLYCLYQEDDRALEIAATQFAEMAGEESLVTDIDQFIEDKGFSPQWIAECWKQFQIKLNQESEREECRITKSCM